MRRLLEERVVKCVQHNWKIKLDADKKDTIEFGNVEVSGDLAKVLMVW